MAIQAHLQAGGSLGLKVTLVLCLFAFVLSSTEAWAEEQPSQTAPQGTGESTTITGESTTIINGKVVEPVPEATMPPVVPPPVETLPAESPAPTPIDPAPSTPEPKVAAPQPAPQWFTVTTNGEAVESKPVPTSQSVTDFGQVLKPEPMPNASPEVVDLAPAPAAPAVAADGYASEPAADPVLPVIEPASASDQVLPAASGLAGLVRELEAEPAAPQGDGGLLPMPANAAPAAGLPPSVLVPTVPASMGGALRLPSSLDTTAASAAASAAASVASATAEVFGSLASGSPGTSSTDGTQEQPSEGTPQPAPAPLAPPAGGISFSPSTGGGLVSPGSGFAPVLVGILALAGILHRRDFRTYLVSCELPKLSSVLLLPLERPG